MGLVDVVLMGLCLNLTCTDEQQEEDPSVFTKDFLKTLAEDIKGKHLKITTLQNQPLSYAAKENDSWVGKGVAFEFINFMKEKYEFDYTVVLPDDDILGNEESGVMGMLFHDVVDVSAAFLPVIPTFWKYTQFSTNLDVGEWVVLLKRPAESATGSGLLAPFTTPVWLLIILSLFVVGPLIHLMMFARAKLCDYYDSNVYPLSTIVWFVYGALLKQGSVLSPVTDSTRIMFATWWIFITILTAYYTANLTAFLTLSRFTLPISNVQDIQEKHYHWATKRGSVIEEIVSDTRVVSKVADALRGSPGEFLSENDSLILQNLVEKRNLMYIREKPIVDYIMYNDYLDKTRTGVEGSDRCHFVITTWAVMKVPRAFAYSRNFKYKPLFDDTLQHLAESGILQFMTRDGLPDTEICPLDLGSTERQLKNSDLFMTYVIVVAGFVVSGATFMVELAVKLYVHTKRKKTNLVLARNSRRSEPEVKVGEPYVNLKNMGKSGDKFVSNVPPPPPYHTLFMPPFENVPNGKKTYVNGRFYWVVKSVVGETRLIPVRTPSALLFQYTN